MPDEAPPSDAGWPITRSSHAASTAMWLSVCCNSGATALLPERPLSAPAPPCTSSNSNVPPSPAKKLVRHKLGSFCPSATTSTKWVSLALIPSPLPAAAAASAVVMQPNSDATLLLKLKNTPSESASKSESASSGLAVYGRSTPTVVVVVVVVAPIVVPPVAADHSASVPGVARKRAEKI